MKQSQQSQTGALGRARQNSGFVPCLHLAAGDLRWCTSPAPASHLQSGENQFLPLQAPGKPCRRWAGWRGPLAPTACAPLVWALSQSVSHAASCSQGATWAGAVQLFNARPCMPPGDPRYCEARSLVEGHSNCPLRIGVRALGCSSPPRPWRCFREHRGGAVSLPELSSQGPATESWPLELTRLVFESPHRGPGCNSRVFREDAGGLAAQGLGRSGEEGHGNRGFREIVSDVD